MQEVKRKMEEELTKRLKTDTEVFISKKWFSKNRYKVIVFFEDSKATFELDTNSIEDEIDNIVTAIHNEILSVRTKIVIQKMLGLWDKI